MQQENDEDVRDFRARLRTLQHVAVEIRGVLDEQNKRLEESDTLLQRTVRQVGHSLRRINEASTRRFNVSLYLVLATLVFVLVLYLLFVVL